MYANGADFEILCFFVFFCDLRTLHTCTQTELIFMCCCLGAFAYFAYVYANRVDLEVPRGSLGSAWGTRWGAKLGRLKAS